MDLPVLPPISPMLARLAHEIPAGDGWLYEPKWDGFRCLVFRDGDELRLESRNERPLERYFPELVAGLLPLLPPRIVLDGEIVIARGGALDFEALLLRIHPAGSRVEKLARELPASYVAFDVLALGDDDLRGRPQRERRATLERALAGVRPPLYLTPATLERATADDWFHRFEGAGLDGVVAKPLDLPYLAGKREMVKVKHQRTADCVVGGFRVHKSGDGVGSLLLGLYDERGVLHHVGVATGLSAARRRELARDLEPLRAGAAARHPWLRFLDGEAQRLPGQESRWTGGKDTSWEPLRPERVVEVAYDHLQGTRFRHATKLLRWRPDREPRSCTYQQLEEVAPREIALVFGAQG